MQNHRTIVLEDWYTTDQAQCRLTRNAGRPLSEGCARKLAQRGKVRSIDLGKRARLYRKEDIDGYLFSNRGPKPKPPARIA